MFLDNYNELLGIIKKIGASSRPGKVNQASKKLSEKAEELLNLYDTDDNEEIDLGELIAKRQNLAQDLAKGEEESKAWRIIDAVKDLEDIVVAYQKDGSSIEEVKEQRNTSETVEINLTDLKAKAREIIEKFEEIKATESCEELEERQKQKNKLETQLKSCRQIKDKLE